MCSTAVASNESVTWLETIHGSVRYAILFARSTEGLEGTRTVGGSDGVVAGLRERNGSTGAGRLTGERFEEPSSESGSTTLDSGGSSFGLWVGSAATAPIIRGVIVSFSST